MNKINHNVINFFVVFASIIIIVAGLKAGSDLLKPIILAIFLALITNPIVNSIEKLKIPRTLATTITLTGVIVALYFIADLLTSSSKSLILDIQAIIDSLVVKISALSGTEYELLQTKINDLNIGSLLSSGLSVLGTIKNSISFTFIVLLSLFLILCESKSWKDKLSLITNSANISETVTREIQTYIFVKSIASVLTGLTIGLLLVTLTEHKYWMLWAIFAMALNFIPNIGSFLAAIPPIAVSLTMGVMPTIITINIFVFVNVIIGSYLEPKIIGEKLGLSTFVVFLSMIFFGWIFDIVGMLLSVPIVVSLKLFIDEISPKNKITKLLK